MKSTLEHEEWRDVIGYEGLYQVSSFGRVKSFCRGKDKILKHDKNCFGYLNVKLYKCGIKRKHFRVNRLVAQAFIPNPDNLPCINHRNECRTDNSVWNLEWCTHKYNNNYGNHKRKLSKPCGEETKRKLSIINSIPIVQLDMEGNVIREWQSAIEAERQLNISHGNINRCCKRKQKTAKGYRWKYKEEKVS